MIPNSKYVGHIIVLAAIGFASCSKTPDATQSSGAPAAETQTAQRGETEIAVDTVLWVQPQRDLDSSKLKTGDKFTGEIAEDVIVNGRPVIPKGSTVGGRVTNSQKAQSQGSAGLLSMELDSVVVHGSRYDVKTSPLTLQGPNLQQALPADPANKVATDVKGAYAPKGGVLQFFLSSPIRLKS